MTKINSINTNNQLKDEIFSLNAEFNADSRKEKINGGIGIYLDDYGQPYVIPVVKKIASTLDFSNFNYLPINGDPVFLEESSRLIFGNNLYNKFSNQLIKQGTVGGTNGLFMWGSLIKLDHKKPNLIIGNPTWENHKKIFNYLGFNIIEYPHLDINNNFNINALETTVKQNPRSFILFHGGPTHNPTGVNPSQKEWILIANLIKENQNQVCFDSAYLGLGDSIESDTFPLRHFLKEKIPTAIIVSYSKNMSLYQHRTGCLILTTTDKNNKYDLESKIKYIFRTVNSNPPAFGEIIAKNILQNECFTNEWFKSLSDMRNNLQNRRQLFSQCSGDLYASLINQKGLFSLLNLSIKQVENLKKEHGIYLLSNSRINFGGITPQNIPKLASAITSLRK